MSENEAINTRSHYNNRDKLPALSENTKQSQLSAPSTHSNMSVALTDILNGWPGLGGGGGAVRAGRAGSRVPAPPLACRSTTAARCRRLHE